jgi:hypothetical protein
VVIDPQYARNCKLTILFGFRNKFAANTAPPENARWPLSNPWQSMPRLFRDGRHFPLLFANPDWIVPSE